MSNDENGIYVEEALNILSLRMILLICFHSSYIVILIKSLDAVKALFQHFKMKYLERRAITNYQNAKIESK